MDKLETKVAHYYRVLKAFATRVEDYLDLLQMKHSSVIQSYVLLEIAQFFRVLGEDSLPFWSSFIDREAIREIADRALEELHDSSVTGVPANLTILSNRAKWWVVRMRIGNWIGCPGPFAHSETTVMLSRFFGEVLRLVEGHTAPTSADRDVSYG